MSDRLRGRAAVDSNAVFIDDVVANVDAELDALAERVRALSLEADDLLHELRRYAEGIDAPPGRLDEVEERLAGLERLKRKHGGTIDLVLAYAETCRTRRDELGFRPRPAETTILDTAASLLPR